MNSFQSEAPFNSEGFQSNNNTPGPNNLLQNVTIKSTGNVNDSGVPVVVNGNGNAT